MELALELALELVLELVLVLPADKISILTSRNFFAGGRFYTTSTFLIPYSLFLNKIHTCISFSSFLPSFFISIPTRKLIHHGPVSHKNGSKR